MEEAKKDHGNDRLPFFFLFLLLLQNLAHATTFGPIPLVKQIENADILVRGTIVGSSWVEMERTVNRPYTYWRLDIREFLKGSLPSNITIRQPGGELGEMGYHVAGTARFSPDEDVFVYLRPTKENGVYEVIGLASGKLTVEKNGHLKTGLGVDLEKKNSFLSISEYRALAQRVVQNSVTQEDQELYTNRMPRHDEETILDKPRGEENNSISLNTYSNSKDKQNNTKIIQKDTQESLPMAEEVRGSSVFWWVVLGLGFAIPLAIFFIKNL